MKKNIKLLIITVLLLPTIVYASGGSSNDGIIPALVMEAFVSIHMSLFVLYPLAKVISENNTMKTFWKLFGIRAGILLFFDFFITPAIAMFDFFAVFIGAFIFIPIVLMKGKKISTNPLNTSVPASSTTNQVTGIEMSCAKCNTVITVMSDTCPNCGEKLEGDNLVVKESTTGSITVPTNIQPKDRVLPSNFDSMYSLSETQMLEKFINKELTKANIENNTKLVPSDVLKRKNILNIVFSILLFIFISMIFFHFPLATYIIGIVILLIFFKYTQSYNLIKYLKKQIKARPGEKITNIVMNTKNMLVENTSRKIFPIYLLIAIVLPLFIFSSPRIIYEKVDGGYAVRYYTFGLKNYKTATIPESYKGEKVVGLRGNTFSNMPFLEKVELPDSVTEIRGQAFKNCYNLKEVNMPKNLTYLGGGAFYNAKKLETIELPDTLTYMGGEAFYGASSLKSVKLSENLEEIRGDTFEYCTSLTSIDIPDSVTRIGGHAFYGDTSLSKVNISSTSKLDEIGSSAFRQCTSLYEITIPTNTYVNERAFKESPTTIYHHDGQYRPIY